MGKLYVIYIPGLGDSKVTGQAIAALASLNGKRRSHILSRYAAKDLIVPPRDSIVPGAHNSRVPTIGHVLTIGTQLIFGAPSFLHFLKKQSD